MLVHNWRGMEKVTPPTIISFTLWKCHSRRTDKRERMAARHWRWVSVLCDLWNGIAIILCNYFDDIVMHIIINQWAEDYWIRVIVCCHHGVSGRYMTTANDLSTVSIHGYQLTLITVRSVLFRFPIPNLRLLYFRDKYSYFSTH